MLLLEFTRSALVRGGSGRAESESMQGDSCKQPVVNSQRRTGHDNGHDGRGRAQGPGG